MTSLRPWREVAIPHTDVLHGRFAQAEYAADLTTVHAGKASPEYQDASEFFKRTFITEGMNLLLDAVVRRLAGKGGDPVIQLQTAFGGGKTHTLLAVYHLAAGKAAISEMNGLAPILDRAGVVDVPAARIVVIDGNDIAANQPRKTPDGFELNTLWGHLAYQLGGGDAYASVVQSDASGTSPGKEVLVDLLTQHQPCVILLDELVAYLRQFEEGKKLTGGTFDSILSFMQALTESVKQVPQALLLASLPESEVELGSDRGKQALAALEKIFGRVQALWKPVSSDEAFEIVRRRLFEPIESEQARETVCRKFQDTYIQYSDQLPSDVVENRYFQRLLASYPLHPEIFDRLYEDWSTLQGFQRTRGVLKLMAKVVHQLWKDNHQEWLILPADLRLDVPEIRNDLVYYLSQGFDPVIERDLDGPNAVAVAIDRDDTRFGQLQAGRKVGRCIFLGGAPAAQELNRVGTPKANRGIDARHILLGCLRPSDTPSVYLDVLGRLQDRTHYLHELNGHYYLDTRPNLRREMEERKRRFNEKEDVLPALRQYLEKVCGKGSLPVHVFSQSSDIPDDRTIRLVVLPPDTPWAIGGTSPAEQAVRNYLTKRGETPRINQNVLIFMAAESGALTRVREQIRTVLAWESIVTDVEKKLLNIDFAQLDQARAEHLKAEKIVPATLREAYKILLVPVMPEDTGREAQLERKTLSTTANASLLDVALKVLHDDEYLLDTWSPIHLQSLLGRYYWKNDVVAKPARAIWEDMCRYVYMPRLMREDIFQATVRDGLKTGLWAAANGQSDAGYKGLSFDAANLFYDSSLLLVKPDAANAQLAAEAAANEAAAKAKSAATATVTVSPGMTQVATSGTTTPAPVQASPGGAVVKAPAKKVRYIGTKVLEGSVASVQLSPMLEELYDVLLQSEGIHVKLRLEIEADCPNGFSEQILRTLRENSTALAVTAEFDE